MRTGLSGGAFDVGLCRIGSAIGDVLGQTAVKQGGLLLHDCDLTAQGRLLHLCDVLPVDQNATARDVIQPLNQLTKVVLPEPE